MATVNEVIWNRDGNWTFAMPNRRSQAAHLFVPGFGQLDAAFCGVLYMGDSIEVFANTPVCRVCVARVREAA